MLGLTVAFTLSIGAMSAAIVHLIPYLTDHGWTDLHAAIAAGLIGATQVAARVVFGLFAERVAAARLALARAARPGRRHRRCWPSSNGAATAWLAVALLGIGQGTTTLLRPLVLSRRLDPLVYGRGAAQSAAWSTVARAVAPLLLAGAAGLGAERLPDRVRRVRRRRDRRRRRRLPQPAEPAPRPRPGVRRHHPMTDRCASEACGRRARTRRRPRSTGGCSAPRRDGYVGTRRETRRTDGEVKAIFSPPMSRHRRRRTRCLRGRP